MEHEQPSASDQREQRMLAVAKLKRAASLPRLKDGRRPPMHNEGVSEGEKGPAEAGKMDLKEEMKKSTARGVPFRKNQSHSVRGASCKVFLVLFLSLTLRRKPASQVKSKSGHQILVILPRQLLSEPRLLIFDTKARYMCVVGFRMKRAIASCLCSTNTDAS